MKTKEFLELIQSKQAEMEKLLYECEEAYLELNPPRFEMNPEKDVYLPPLEVEQALSALETMFEFLKSAPFKGEMK